MNTNTLNEYLLELVQESSKELLKIYHNKSSGRKTLLKFPKYREKDGEKKRRISEQEFRFVFTSILQLKKDSFSSLSFSVETPTENTYKFSKDAKGERSASSDLSFYNGEDKIMNIEFKANPTSQDSINKDIQKLTKENVNGAWIHLLENEDAGTVKTLFTKFEDSFSKFPNSKKPISFHILILKTKTLLSRKGKQDETEYSKNIFNIKYESWKKLKDKPDRYYFYNGERTDGKNLDVDWQIDIFDI